MEWRKKGIPCFSCRERICSLEQETFRFMVVDRTRLFNQSFSFLLVLFGLPLLFLPKINLIALGGKETAGVRLDDFVLFFLFLLIFWAHFSLKRRVGPVEKWVFAIAGFSLLSFAVNRFLVFQGMLHVDASLFYCLRLIEYFVFFYVGAMAAQFFSPSKVIKAFFAWNLVIMFLQKMGLVGQFNVEGYYPLADDRVVGIASFPSEAGMLLDMAFCYLIFDEGVNRRFSRMLPPDIREFINQTHACWLFFITSILVIITGSRIAIVALAFVFLFKLYDTLKKGSIGTWISNGILLAAALIVGGILIMQTSALSGRSSELLSMKNIDLIGKVWNNINLSYDPIGNESVKYAAYDMSWWMRIHKWCYALKIYWLHPECWLLGVGPGFAMAALDGGWLRILTENGLVGCFLYWKLFSSIARQSTQLKWMVVAFAINMIFFDVYLAYKPMSLLFFVSGSVWAAQTATSALRLSPKSL